MNTIQWDIAGKYHDKIDLETAKFLYQEASKHIDAVYGVYNKATDRGYTLIAVLIGSAPFVLNILDKANGGVSIIILCTFVVMALVAGLFLYQIIKPNKGQSPGSQPKEYLTDELIDYYSGKDMNKEFVLMELERMQYKIDAIEASNRQKAYQYRGALLTALIGYAIIVLIYIAPFIS